MGIQLSLPVVIDGTGSCSELTGDDPDNVCCEASTLDRPQFLISAKASASEAGFTALLAPTEGITHARLEELGFDEEFARFHTALTELTVSASDGLPVGGVLAPSDPIAAEYGKNVFESAYFAHLEQITLMKDAGASFILLKNFDKLWDMRAGVLAAKSADMMVIVTMQTDDEGQSRSDTDYLAALITLQALGADAFGIDCTEGTDVLAELLHRACSHAEIPLIAAVDLSRTTAETLSFLCENGASGFLNTAQTFREDVPAAVRRMKPAFDPAAEKDSYAAAIYREAFFLPEYIEPSEPLPCDYDMADEIIDLDDETVNVIYIELHSTDDAAYLADNAVMSRLPFMIHTDDPTTLEAALRYFQGRLIVDGQCEIEKDQLQRLTDKYGAILY